MKVLIPVQDEIFGDAIADLITSHSWPADPEFKLLTVLDYEVYGELLNEVHTSDAFRQYYADKQTAARRTLKDYAKRLRAAIPGASLSVEVLAGVPKEIILDFAGSWGADLIVMGSHARKGFSRFLLGSVSMSVLSQAPCSVIIVKLPQQAKTATEPCRTTVAAAS